MRILILSFAAGIWLTQQQAELPSWPELGWLAAAVAAASALAAALRGRLPGAARVVAAVAVFALGFLFASGRGQLQLADTLPLENEGRDVEVVGVVSGLPQEFDRGLRFDFDVEQAQARVPQRISLAWYRGQREEEWQLFREVHAGERWQLTVRLKRPHGNANPHGFDYEAWLFERGIRATGYVRSRLPNAAARRLRGAAGHAGRAPARAHPRALRRGACPRANSPACWWHWRSATSMPSTPSKWQLFNRTGTTHLMSISGLHVTMVAGLCYWLRRRPVAARAGARAAPAGAAGGGGGRLAGRLRPIPCSPVSACRRSAPSTC